MKTPQEIEDRILSLESALRYIRRALMLDAKDLGKLHEFAITREISQLRWVLGEYDTSRSKQ